MKHFHRHMVDSTPKQERSRAVFSLIGNRPSVPLRCGRERTMIYARCTFLNPSGSVRDHLAKHVLLDAAQRRLRREFRLRVGTSSGANIVATLLLATELGPKATLVILLGDRAERYFSTPLFGLAGNEHMPDKTIEPQADLVH